ncbi:MAG: hypothetical protein Q8R05_02540 [Candidatus Omnitrophota bacterium]|nr:hypothetical protein [Candidatus Omnitrophota bacterium]
MHLFPKMIKEISFENLLALRKHKNLFILFWILYFAADFLSKNWILSATPLTLLLSMMGFIFLICSVVFLFTTANRLYKDPISYVVIYSAAIIAPLFLVILRRVDIFIFQMIIFIDIFIKFIVFALLIADFKYIFKYFQEGNKNSTDKIIEKVDENRNNILIKEGLILFAFIISIILLLFVFPKIFPRLTDGWNGLIFAQIMSIYTSTYPFYILVKGTIIGIKSIAEKVEAVVNI